MTREYKLIDCHPNFKNEPLLDFSQEEVRQLFKEALRHIKSLSPLHVPLIIGGEHYRGEIKKESINPADTKEVLGVIAQAGREEVELAMSCAQNVWENKWRFVPYKQRAEYLLRAADIMRRHRYELAAWMVLEAGKNWYEADADVVEAIDFLRYYAYEMLRLGEARKTQNIAGEDNFYGYKSLGVGVVISPWNFPLAITAGMTAAAIVAGNTVLLKPSSQTPVIAYMLFQAFRRAGLPDGVLNFVPGAGSEIGDLLVRHENTKFVAFTGSMETGLRIQKVASQAAYEQRNNVRKLILEMGGKNAIIIDETADLDKAVNGVMQSAFGYQGQKCSACSRAIVLEGVYEDFVKRLKEAASDLRIGPPENPANFMGPVIDDKAFGSIKEYIEIGKKEAKVLLEVRISEDLKKGYFIGPVIFKDVLPDARIAQEEIFGPVLSVIKARDFEEALKIANGTKYALTGGLYSENLERIEAAKERFDVGNFYINRKITGAIVGRQPFGGHKMSGIGSKAGGPDYLKQFMVSVNVCENTTVHGATRYLYLEEEK